MVLTLIFNFLTQISARHIILLKLKCNVDAIGSKTSFSLCIHADAGFFLDAKIGRLEPCLDVAAGEAMSVLAAVQDQLGLGHIVFELDSKSVVECEPLPTSQF